MVSCTAAPRQDARGLPEEEMTTHQLQIEGMSCGHCVARVSRTLQGLDGVVVNDVKIGEATISVDPARVSLAQITAALDDVGFPARAAGQAS